MTENFAPHTKDPVITPSEVAEVAYGLGIPPAVLIACCGTESRYSPDSLMRYEKDFKWVTKGITEPELTGRKTSWGIGHVMGQTLRDLGFKGDFFALLSDHKQAAYWAGRYLLKCHERAMRRPLNPQARDVWEMAIGAYNTGGFATFPQEHIERFRWWRDRAHRFGFHG